MLIDLQDACGQSNFRSTVCIIGAGVAGLLLARKLASYGLHANLLEAGGRDLEARSQQLYDVEREGRNYQGATEGRFRLFGGSSTRWGGQLLPYTSDVFDPPPGTPSAKWPIRNSDLDSHYSELYKIMGVPDAQPLGPQPFASDVRIRFSKWAPFHKRNLAKTIGKECLTTGRISTFVHANAVSINVKQDSQLVDSVTAKNYNGQEYRFYAKFFIVCTGTIETCRLLLASTDTFREGVGNTSDQVGRYFHDHLSVAAATLTGQARRKFTEHFAPLFVENALFTPKLEAPVALRQKNRLLSVMAHFSIEEPEDTGIASIRRFLQDLQAGRGIRKLPAFALASTHTSGQIAKVLWYAKILKRRFVSDRAIITLRLDSEQLPNPNQRIKLSSRSDATGMPKAIVQWCISDEERRTVRIYARCMDHFLKGLGFEPIGWNPRIWNRDDDWRDLARDTYHAMGGTRMGDDPATSVVNRQLQVHTVPNLFIASCSTFPGGGSSNPTFTLMALALRLANHIRQLNASPLAVYRPSDATPNISAVPSVVSPLNSCIVRVS